MPSKRKQMPVEPIKLTRTEQKAADIDEAVKRQLAKTGAAQNKKIDRLRALRLARDADEPVDSEKPDS